MESLKLPVAIALLGPTASGKTDLAMRIAERFAVEIISVDSAQIYRHMNVGTAKPEAWMREQVVHHLIDLMDPTEAYSAGRFCADASALMQSITQRNRTPLLVGGTMLYFNALWHGLNDLPRASEVVRQGIDARAAQQGWPALHAELEGIDPTAAARIRPHDARRIQRALEVYELTGAGPTLHFEQARNRYDSHRFVALALMDTDRLRLHERIALRFDAMLANGLVEELATLRQRFALRAEHNSMRCVGYRQAWHYLEGHTSHQELREQGIAATRQLAKRQITWMRSMPDLVPLDPHGTTTVGDAIAHIDRVLRCDAS